MSNKEFEDLVEESIERAERFMEELELDAREVYRRAGVVIDKLKNRARSKDAASPITLDSRCLECTHTYNYHLHDYGGTPCLATRCTCKRFVPSEQKETTTTFSKITLCAAADVLRCKESDVPDEARKLRDECNRLKEEIEKQAAKYSSVERALVVAEAALADIGDADREPGDDLTWCENRAAKALPTVRAAIAGQPVDSFYHFPKKIENAMGELAEAYRQYLAPADVMEATSHLVTCVRNLISAYSTSRIQKIHIKI